MKLLIPLILSTLIFTDQTKSEDREPYVLEVTTFSYKAKVDAELFWSEDAKVEANYTSKQPGFISRESGYSKETNEVVVVVRWKTTEAADASMQKFMEDTAVSNYVMMIEGSTMKMSRYDVR